MMQQTIFDKRVRDLEPEIAVLARKAELGELRKIYHASTRNTARNGGGWALLVYGILYFVFATFAVLSSASPAWLLPGLILVVPGIFLIIPPRIYALWHIYLWDSGFVYEKGPLRQVFRWDGIEHIQSELRFGGLIYRVRRQDGYEITLNKIFPNVTELITTVAEEFLRQATAEELKIAPPRNRAFGEFKLDRQSISDKQGALTWQEVEELTIENGVITVLKRE